MNLSKVTLPTYSKTEEIINAASHGAGIIVGAVSFILCLSKSIETNALIGNIIFSLAVIILYTCSTLYHSVTNTTTKKIMRLIDHSSIFILITGTSTAMSVICVLPHSPFFSITVSTVSIALSILGTVLTVIDQEKYKKVQLVLYLVVGWISVILIYPIYKYRADAITLIIITAIGGIIYTIGTVFYKLGKKKKYFHSVFHFFVLAGTLIHLAAIYMAI